MAQRPNELTPNASPAHFWGAELRARRTARGMSLEALGKAVYRDRSFLAKVERGERSVSADLAQACDQAIGASGTLIRLHALINSADRGHVAQPLSSGGHVAKMALDVAKPSILLAADTSLPAPLDEGEDITVPARTSDGRVIFVSVSRRHFIQGLGGAAVLGATGAVSAQGSHAYSAAPDVPTPEHFEQMRRTLADSDNLFGPRQVVPTVQRQLSIMQQLQQDLRNRDSRDLWKVQTEFADLAGWLHQDLGDHRAAQYWLDRALEWSYTTGDPDDIVFILTRKSNLAGDMQDAAEAIALAEASLRMARPRSRFAALAATFAGHGYAMAGDQDNCARFYDRANELLLTAEPDESPWAQFLDSSYIAVWHAGSMSRLGNYQAAAEEYQSALLALPPGFRRDQGVYLAREAQALAGQQEAEQAASLGLQALDIGTETASGRILTELGRLDNSLSQWRGVPAVAQFREAIAGAIPHQA